MSRKRQEIKSHMITLEKTYPCTLCVKSYTNKNALAYHYSAKHEKRAQQKSANTEDKQSGEGTEKNKKLEKKRIQM